MEEKELKLDMLPGIGERPCTMERRDRLRKRRQAKRRKREIEDRILLVFAILCMISLCVAGMARTAQSVIEIRELKPKEQSSAQIKPDLTYFTSKEWDHTELLAACVEAEAGNQGLLGKQMVADVILNRVDDPEWPDSIESVISQKYQFTSYWDGGMESAVPSEETYEAIRLEMEERSCADIFYFRTDCYSDYGTPWKKIGSHYFSKK